MLNKFLVIIPVNVQKLENGFSSFNKITTVVCEASTLLEVYMKYPLALKIKQLA